MKKILTIIFIATFLSCEKNETEIMNLHLVGLKFSAFIDSVNVSILPFLESYKNRYEELHFIKGDTVEIYMTLDHEKISDISNKYWYSFNGEIIKIKRGGNIEEGTKQGDTIMIFNKKYIKQ